MAKSKGILATIVEAIVQSGTGDTWDNPNRTSNSHVGRSGGGSGRGSNDPSRSAPPTSKSDRRDRGDW